MEHSLRINERVSRENLVSARRELATLEHRKPQLFALQVFFLVAAAIALILAFTGWTPHGVPSLIALPSILGQILAYTARNKANRRITHLQSRIPDWEQGYDEALAEMVTAELNGTLDPMGINDPVEPVRFVDTSKPREPWGSGSPRAIRPLSAPRELKPVVVQYRCTSSAKCECWPCRQSRDIAAAKQRRRSGQHCEPCQLSLDDIDDETHSSHRRMA